MSSVTITLQYAIRECQGYGPRRFAFSIPKAQTMLLEKKSVLGDVQPEALHMPTEPLITNVHSHLQV